MRLRSEVALESGQVAAFAAVLLAFFVALLPGLVEAGRIYGLAQWVGWTAEVGVMAGLARRDVVGSQQCGCPRLLSDAAAYAEQAVDLAFSGSGHAHSRACAVADGWTVRCTVSVQTASPVLAFLGLGPVTVTRSRTGRLELQTR
jgi:hypothetical protein